MKSSNKFPKAYRNYIVSLITTGKSLMYADEYHIIVEFPQEPLNEDDPDGTTMMTINVDDVYLSATIRIYPEVYEMYLKKQYSRIGEYVLHELSHLLTHPFRDLYEDEAGRSLRRFYRDILERQTQRIANIIHNLLPEDWCFPENHK